MTTTPTERPCVVLDTNVLLDMWVFQDTHTALVHDHVKQAKVHWLVTAAMREELLRVLGYAHIVPRLAKLSVTAVEVLAEFDRWSQMQPTAARAPYVCKDEDDQKFIDLAVVHKALLISKDKQVLRLTNRLARLSVRVTTAF